MSLTKKKVFSIAPAHISSIVVAKLHKLCFELVLHRIQI